MVQGRDASGETMSLF